MSDHQGRLLQGWTRESGYPLPGRTVSEMRNRSVALLKALGGDPELLVLSGHGEPETYRTEDGAAIYSKSAGVWSYTAKDWQTGEVKVTRLDRRHGGVVEQMVAAGLLTAIQATMYDRDV